MDGLTFRRHLSLRHIPAGDFANLQSFYFGIVEGNDPDRKVFETYHKRLHSKGEYDHEHREPQDQ
jgi:hypothetical protein